MNKITYWCLDDEEAITSSIALLNESDPKLNLIWKAPKALSEQIREIKSVKLSGLILDLRLDENRSADGDLADYRAGTLAQQIRTLAAEGAVNEFPIILWSIDRKLSRSFLKDPFSQDLFDAVYVKNDIPDRALEIANELSSFAEGYATLRKALSRRPFSFLKTIGLSEKDIEKFGTLLLTKFGPDSLKKPASEFARFILAKIISKPGPLIDEDILAARLGVDKNNSKGWEKCKSELAKCRYTGPFDSLKPKWWAHRVEGWWMSQKQVPGSLTSLDAVARVAFLRKTIGRKDLISAAPIANGYSGRYWTICQVSKRPLDPIDGILLSILGEESWHDRQYISIEEAIKFNKKTDDWTIHTIETARLVNLKRASKAHGKA